MKIAKEKKRERIQNVTRQAAIVTVCGLWWTLSRLQSLFHCPKQQQMNAQDVLKDMVGKLTKTMETPKSTTFSLPASISCSAQVSDGPVSYVIVVQNNYYRHINELILGFM